MKTLRVISRLITGLVFMFSGTIKAVDPLGTAYKFNDYFQAFHIEFLRPLALVLAILLFTAEFISGFSVLSGFRQKTGIWGTMILMIVFTPLTLVLAISNPVSDCGCFGDAIRLTNWQTFGKNIILIIPVIILFTGRKKVSQVCDPLKEWTVILGITILFVIFSLLNIRYLQLFDFLPYKTGTNIPESMKIPDDRPVDEYLTTFIYEKDGVQKEFSLENYPAGDSTWKFIDQRTKLVRKGYVPPIHDLSFTSTDNEDITGWILSNPGYTILMISSRLDKADKRHLNAGFEFGSWCTEKGISFYIVTSSGADEVKKYSNGLDFCFTDETTLKTMIRSNPGYMLLHKGSVAGKWSWASLPPKDKFKSGMSAGEVIRMNNKSPILIVYSLALSAILLVLLISSLFAGTKGRSEN